MIIYGIIPIRTGMTAGTCYKIVVYLALQQPFVQIPVHIKEEIAFTAIDNQSQITVLQFINLIDYRMTIPIPLHWRQARPTASSFSQVIRKRTDIHSATHTSRRTEYVAVADGIPQRTVSTHTQTADGTRTLLGNRSIMLIRILHQFRRDEVS